MKRHGFPVRIRHRIAFTLRRIVGFTASLAESALGIRRLTSTHSSSLISSNSNPAPVIVRSGPAGRIGFADGLDVFAAAILYANFVHAEIARSLAHGEAGLE
jgi:hypothetical protein